MHPRYITPLEWCVRARVCVCVSEHKKEVLTACFLWSYGSEVSTEDNFMPYQLHLQFLLSDNLRCQLQSKPCVPVCERVRDRQTQANTKRSSTSHVSWMRGVIAGEPFINPLLYTCSIPINIISINKRTDNIYIWLKQLLILLYAACWMSKSWGCAFTSTLWLITQMWKKRGELAAVTAQQTGDRGNESVMNTGKEFLWLTAFLCQPFWRSTLKGCRTPQAPHVTTRFHMLDI